MTSAARAVHQFHSGSATGDAVTNSLFLTQRFLRELGFNSEIFVEHIGSGLTGRVRSFREYSSRNDTFLIHHSMGHDQTEWIARLRGQKVLVYHNITPPEFFPRGSVLAKYARLGREQLSQFRPMMDAAICDSPFNAEELERLNYANVHAIPLLVDVTATASEPWASDLVANPPEAFTVLFVGRIAENKCQHDLIEVLKHLRQLMDRPVQLILLGDFDPEGRYFQRLRSLVASLGLTSQVTFTGKVPSRELWGWYRRADAFLCLSEHEGFGVPLIESMVFDLPVLAYDSTSVASTLDGAGLLLQNKNPRKIAALLRILSEDKVLRRLVVEGQRQRIERLRPDILKTRLVTVLATLGLDCPPSLPSERPPPRPRWQIEGPFETNYSLALVNREIGRALWELEPNRVSLFATEGPGDYSPRDADLKRLPELESLWALGRKGAMPEVTIRNLYPPRVADMDGLLKLLLFFWEESQVPDAWVEEFNRHLDGCLVPSHFVKKALIDSGVTVPITVVGLGAEHVFRKSPSTTKLKLGRSFRFLHISSGFPRKGLDVLLAAYGAAFSTADDVTLVLKTFPNIHNRTQEQVQLCRKGRPDYPDVVLLDRELPLATIASLYRKCHAFVAPSRGEGFGLPLAEAMAFGMPVITTSGGGQADFCTPETSWLVDFEFQRSSSHIGQEESVWMEPDANELAKRLREVFEASPSALKRRTEIGRALVEKNFNWHNCARKTLDFSARLREPKLAPKREMKAGWFSTWNTRCGIATYSRYLLQHFDFRTFNVTVLANRVRLPLQVDEPNVVRCWKELSRDLRALEESILKARLDVVVFQFNFGFLRMEPFGRLIRSLTMRGIRVVVVLHSTQDVVKPHYRASLRDISADLRLADRILVHTIADLNSMKRMGLVSNVALFPHGVFDTPARDASYVREVLGFSKTKRVVASFGFLLPHKGTEQLIKALRQIRNDHDVLLLLVNSLYPGSASQKAYKTCLQAIAEYRLEEHVALVTDFLPESKSLALLQSADLIVFPYQSTAESASGAVRFGLSSRRPVACTPLPIFADVQPVTLELPGIKPDDLATGISALLEDPSALGSNADRQARWLKSHSWAVLARRLGRMIQGLIPSEQGEWVTQDSHEQPHGENIAASI